LDGAGVSGIAKTGASVSLEDGAGDMDGDRLGPGVGFSVSVGNIDGVNSLGAGLGVGEVVGKVDGILDGC
jgi:hypothetical protein